MKFHVCYSESHKLMAEKFLIPSVCDQFSVSTHVLDQECPTGEYSSTGWPLTMSTREAIMLRVLAESTEPFVWSDADVVCHGFTESDALSELGHYDIAAIDEGEDRFCAGFMIVRPSSGLYKLFEIVLETPKIVEQDLLNRTARGLGLKIHLLPPMIYTSIYHLLGGIWDGSESSIIGSLTGVKVFHANWLIGVEIKLRALEAAKKAFSG